MNIRKIKLKDGRWTVRAEEATGDPEAPNTRKVEVESSETPRAELHTAFHQMVEPALDMISAPEGWYGKAIMSGVSISHEEERGIGVVMTVLVAMPEVASGPLVINTSYVVEDGGEGPSLPSDVYRGLMKLIEEAQRYLDGERLQLDMLKSAGVDETQPERPKRGRRKAQVNIGGDAD